MTTKERIVIFLKHKKLSQAAFEKNCGLSNGYVNNIRRSISDTVLQKIVLSYPEINPIWLRMGEGEMLKSDDTTESLKNKKEEDTVSSYKLVPLINMDAVGGMHTANGVVNQTEFVVKMIAFDGALDEDRCIRITGRSMEPLCPPGSIVLIREVEYWREYFGFGNIFVLLLKDGRRILKKVVKSDMDPKESIKCVSLNHEFPEEDLPKNFVTGVWKVVKILIDNGW